MRDISEVLKRLEEKDRRHSKKVVKLPCGHATVEIRDKAEDQFIVCPKCLKKFLLTYSLNPKIKWQP